MTAIKIWEHEISDLLKSQNLDLLFLVETDSDTTSILEEKDYKLKGYHTVFALRKEEDLKTKLFFLFDEKCVNFKVRTDLMSPEFPSIWCEIVREKEKNFLVCGFYREWSHEGINLYETYKRVFCNNVVSIEFSPLWSAAFSNSWYRLHNGDYTVI